jgi:hypothetical protein
MVNKSLFLILSIFNLFLPVLRRLAKTSIFLPEGGMKPPIKE